MRRSDGDDDTTIGSTVDETLSGHGIWTGLVPVARSVAAEYDLEKDRVVRKIDRLFERYRWFEKRIDHPGPKTRCEQILGEPPREPAAWHRALVELSMLGTVQAQIFLEQWEPPHCDARDFELELFRRICAVKCDR